MGPVFENPWVIGVGGGIISGFLVFFVTQFIFNNGRAADYRRRVDATNREVIYALRPGIPEGEVSDREIVDALIHSTARKNSVAFQDVYDCAVIGEELIKEVIDSSFISAKQKAAYCNNLRAMMIARPVATVTEREQTALAANRIDFRVSTLSTFMAVLLALITAAMTVATTALFAERQRTTPDIQALLLPTLITVALTFGMAMALFLYRQTRRARQIHFRGLEVETPSETKP